MNYPTGMRKNVDKYNYCLRKVEEWGDGFAAAVVGDVPTTVYEVSGSTAPQVVEWNVTKVEYFHPHSTWSRERPTRAQVAAIEKYLENFVPDPDKVRLMVENFERGHRTSTSFQFTARGNEWYSSREIAQAIAVEIEAKYRLEDGQIRCDYCHQPVDADKVFKRRIISYANYGPAGKWGQYCNGQCAMHDQFAHEG